MKVKEMIESLSPSPLLSIVVPVYNEKDSIKHFLDAVDIVVQPLQINYEIVFVNDGSTDETLLKLVSESEKNNNIVVIDLSRNFGKERALSAGIAHAEGQAIIPMDVDLQDPPELIPEMLEKWREGFDQVYATRKERHGEGFVKKSTASLFYYLFQRIVSFPIPKNTGDFRLIDASVAKALNSLPENNRFMKGLFSWVGFKQTSIYYDRAPRFAGKTKWNYKKLIGLAWEGITSFSTVPLKLVTVIGFFISVTAFAYGFWIILKTMLWGESVTGYPSLMTVVLFIGGINLLALGVLGEYIGKIYEEVKKRPVYLVRKIYGR